MLAVAAGVPLVAVAELNNHTLIGAGVRSRPAYDGASAQYTELVPVVRYFGEPWFVRSTQGPFEAGARTELAPDLHAGAQVAFEAWRRGRDSDFLRAHGVQDVGAGASLGVQLEWDHKFGPMPVTVLTRLRKHTEAYRGAQADLRLSAGLFESGPVSAGLVAQGLWADARSVGSLYGIGAAQAASTGLPAFTPAAGLLATGAGLLWSVDLGARWSVLGSFESRRLHTDAAQSPLVQRTSGYYAIAGIAYRP
jgi:outer membrane protein